MVAINVQKHFQKMSKLDSYIVEYLFNNKRDRVEYCNEYINDSK